MSPTRKRKAPAGHIAMDKTVLSDTVPSSDPPDDENDTAASYSPGATTPWSPETNEEEGALNYDGVTNNVMFTCDQRNGKKQRLIPVNFVTNLLIECTGMPLTFIHLQMTSITTTTFTVTIQIT